jgi:hypothetical protein
MTRAEPSGIRLSLTDACQVLGMLDRGDHQHNIAAWFGVNLDASQRSRAENYSPRLSQRLRSNFPLQARTFLAERPRRLSKL